MLIVPVAILARMFQLGDEWTLTWMLLNRFQLSYVDKCLKGDMLLFHCSKIYFRLSFAHFTYILIYMSSFDINCSSSWNSQFGLFFPLQNSHPNTSTVRVVVQLAREYYQLPWTIESLESRIGWNLPSTMESSNTSTDGTPEKKWFFVFAKKKQ